MILYPTAIPGNIHIISKFKAYTTSTVNTNIKKEDITEINAYLYPEVVDIIAYGTGRISASNPKNGIYTAPRQSTIPIAVITINGLK